MNNQSNNLEKKKSKPNKEYDLDQDISIDKKKNDTIINKTVLDETKLQEEINQINKQIKEIKLRGQAKIDNIRKINQSNIKLIKYNKLEEFSKKILPIIDYLEEIIKISHKKNIQNSNIIQGLELTLQSLLNIIEKFGIKREGKENELFQDHLHQSVSNQTSEIIPPNHIISVIKFGYTLNNIVLRKALVQLSI
ncbi:nucleotide exchange factor GrpE [Buchnera aphidicola (Formosaphis micheliae)]|uniref:nucleotide exchange factor GrpE n=1 Tax=Buchnera aphidicola TaxID=9 RepID=UPI0031CCAF8E